MSKPNLPPLVGRSPDEFAFSSELVTVDEAKSYAEEAVRQALAAQADSLRAFADRKYCAAVEYARRNEALGWEGKAKSGRFGHEEYACHKKMNEAYGAHFGIYEALEQIAPPPEPRDG